LIAEENILNEDNELLSNDKPNQIIDFKNTDICKPGIQK
jgi:hypothetical protein